MKIAHVATGYPIRFHGGITNYVRTLATAQSERGHDVTVVAGPDTADHSALRFTERAFSTRRLRPFSLKIVRRDSRARELAAELAEFDVVHFHMGLDLALEFYAGLPAAGVPYVASLHDYYLVCPRITMIDSAGQVQRRADLDRCVRCVGVLDQIDLLEKGRRVLGVTLPRIPSNAMRDRRDVMNTFLRGAAVVLPVSERVRAIVADVEPNAHYEVMHIGNESAGAERLPKEESAFLRATFLGTLSEHKGAKVLQDLMRRVRRSDLEFHFYGRGDVRVLEELRAMGLHDHGPYRPSDLPAIMARSDVGLVLPVWEDNAPQVVMEFLNFGVPVFGTRMGGIPDFVDDRVGALFDPFDERDLERFVRRLETIARSELAAMSANAPRLKTPAEHAEEILALYARVVNE